MVDGPVPAEEPQETQVEESPKRMPEASAVSGPGVGGSAADAPSHDDKVAALEDRLLRLAADFENFKKRAAREKAEYVTLANERLIGELLPILDDLERALVAAAEHEEAKLEEGVALVHRALAQLLERHGVKAIATDGMFDPHIHEALLAQPSEAAEGSVIEVVQKGYALGERVVRPARVVVAGPLQEGNG